jgi:3-isopropylmalate/(R)-2-methylmalate dehydratase small subunit
MEAFTTLTATACPIETINVDTDALLPARFLKYPRKGGYGDFLLRDLRFTPEDEPKPEFPLNAPAYRGANIVIGNTNFGCGSAREGAVYALFDYGFRCVIAPSFGDIFFNNACKNGLLPVRLPASDVADLRSLATREPGTLFNVDLDKLLVTAPGLTPLPFSVDPFKRMCLLQGLDDISLTRQYQPDINAFGVRAFAEQPWLALPARAR